MDQVVIAIVDSIDVSKARRAARLMAQQAGMNRYEISEIEITVSELATNLFRHACGGTVSLERLEEEGRAGVRIVSRDEGPGIEDLGLAMKEGYSTTDSMGSGLPGVRRMMDEFTIESESGHGTIVVATKWRK